MTPTLYEFWLMKLTPLVYQARLPGGTPAGFQKYDVRRVIEWMTEAKGGMTAEARKTAMLTGVGAGAKCAA